MPVGAHFVPSRDPTGRGGSDRRPSTRAFAQMAASRASTPSGSTCSGRAIEPEPGRYDERHLGVLDAIARGGPSATGCCSIRRCSSAARSATPCWDVPWRAGRQPHRDPGLLRLQADARGDARAALGRRRRRSLAWDLTDEPPFWLFRGHHRRRRPRPGRTALGRRHPGGRPRRRSSRSGRPARRSGSGRSARTSSADAARLHDRPPVPDLRAGALSGRPARDPDDARRRVRDGPRRRARDGRSCSTSTARRRPSSIPDRIAGVRPAAAPGRASAAGAIGFLAWCWTDAEPAAFGRAPYVRQPHETQFGVIDAPGRCGRAGGSWPISPRRSVRSGRSRWPGRRRARRPVAAIPVPHEYVRPYDAGGLRPRRCTGRHLRTGRGGLGPGARPAPLVRGWLNGYVLAARAGAVGRLPARATRRALAGPSPLVLLPAPLTSTSSSLLHVRTAFWRGAADHFARGGSLWLSCSADAAVPGMADLAGCRSRRPGARPTGPVRLRFVRRWGPFAAGDELVAAGRRTARWRSRRARLRRRRTARGRGGRRRRRTRRSSLAERGSGRVVDLLAAGRAAAGRRARRPRPRRPDVGPVRGSGRGRRRARAGRRRSPRRDERALWRARRRPRRAHQPRPDAGPRHRPPAGRGVGDPPVRARRRRAARGRAGAAGTPEPVGASVEVLIAVDLAAHGSTLIGWRAER